MAPIEPQMLFNERKKQCKSQLSLIYLPKIFNTTLLNMFCEVNGQINRKTKQTYFQRTGLSIKLN